MSRLAALVLLGSLVLSASCRSEPAPAAVASAAQPSVPVELAPVFVLLDSVLSPADRDTIRATPAADLGRFHFGLGLSLRNQLGLWHDSAARAPWVRRGLRHPEAISQVMIEAYWLHLHGAPIPLDSLVRASPPAALPVRPAATAP